MSIQIGAWDTSKRLSELESKTWDESEKKYPVFTKKVTGGYKLNVDNLRKNAEHFKKETERHAYNPFSKQGNEHIKDMRRDLSLLPPEDE